MDYQKKDALKYATTLAESEYEQINNAVTALLEEKVQKNVIFAGNNCSFMFQYMFDMSYPESLVFAEEITSGLVSSLFNDQPVQINKKNGDRIVFFAKYFDRRGIDITETKKEEFCSHSIRIEELLKELDI